MLMCGGCDLRWWQVTVLEGKNIEASTLYEKNIQKLQKTFTANEKDRGMAQLEISATKQQLEALHANVAEAHGEEAATKLRAPTAADESASALSHLQEEYAQLLEKSNDQVQELQDATTQLREENRAKVDQESVVRLTSARLKALQSAEHAADEKLHASIEELGELKVQMVRLQAENREAAKKLAWQRKAAKDELAQERERSAEHQQKLDEARGEVASLQHQIDDLHAAVASQSDATGSMQAKLVVEKMLRCYKASQAAADKESGMQRLQGSYDRVTAEKATALEESGTLREQLKELKVQHLEVKDEAKRAELKAAQHTEKQLELQRQLQVVDRQKMELQARLQEAEDAQAQSRQQWEEYCQESKATIAALQAACEASQANSDAAWAEVFALRTACSAAEENVESHKVTDMLRVYLTF